MPVRRAESLATLRVAMSRSRQLGGFPTSSVFGFRQTHAHPPSRQAALQTSDSAPGSIGVFNRGIGSDEQSISYP